MIVVRCIHSSRLGVSNGGLPLAWYKVPCYPLEAGRATIRAAMVRRMLPFTAWKIGKDMSARRVRTYVMAVSLSGVDFNKSLHEMPAAAFKSRLVSLVYSSHAGSKVHDQ